MRTRKIERQIKWNKNLEETISVLEGGEAYAMNTFRIMDREGRAKFMSDIRTINDAPQKSIVWDLCKKTLGSHFKEMVYNVQLYCRTIVRIENARA